METNVQKRVILSEVFEAKDLSSEAKSGPFQTI